MMNKKIILFLNSIEDEHTFNLIQNIPHKSEYSFIFSFLSDKEIKGLSQLTEMKVNKISCETLFQPDSIYFLNDEYHKLNDLITTLLFFDDINLHIIVTSIETFKNVKFNKTEQTTIIIDDTIYNTSEINLPIDYKLSLEKIPDYFVKDKTINNIIQNLNKKYHFTFEESQNIKNSLAELNTENTILKKIVDNINLIILLTDKFANINFVNKYFTDVTGFDPKMVIGKNIKQLFNNDLLIMNYDKIISQMKLGKDYQILLTDNYNYFFDVNFIPIMDNNNLSDILVIFYDISETEDLSNKDSITGVGNRDYFIQSLERFIKNEKEENLALFLIDLSNFKEINDTLGHDFGNLVLQEVADRIDKISKQEYCFSRFYCDQFIFMIPKLKNKHDIILKVQDIINEFNEPLKIQNHVVHISAHLGLAIYPQDGKNISTLLNNLEIALYTTMKNNSPYLFYNEEMRTPIINKLELETNIHHAVYNQEFVLYYQPIVDINTGSLTSVETLLRWKSKDGILSPNYFLDYIEKTGQITKISEYTMKDALYKFQDIQKNMQSLVHISFNLSPKQLLNETLVDNFTKIIKETSINPQNIMFEITENITTESIQNNTNIFEYLENLGVSFSMDDFGTGYSCLGQLKNYPIKKIKIDKVLVHKMEVDTDYQLMLRGVIKLAHAMNYTVVAEGVETKRQLELLKEFNCDEIQGYYICKPIPFEELTKILEVNKGNFKTFVN